METKKLLTFMLIGITFAFVLVFMLGFTASKGFSQNQQGGIRAEGSTGVEKYGKNRIPSKMKSNPRKDHSDIELTFYQTLLEKEGIPPEQTEKTNKSSQIEKQVEQKKPSQTGKQLEQKKPLEIKQRVSKEVKENTKSFRGYAVQVGAFPKKEHARKMANKLKKKGYPVYIVSSNIPMKGMWHRVRVGHFQDLKKAKKFGLTIEMKERLPTHITFVSE
ncbi:MAG: SPOR domain-containing protein [Thermodesulfobacteriota bacterium]